MIRILVLLVGLCVLPARAEEVVAGMSQNRIAITANFDGSEILIFGAVKRETPIPSADPLGVIITVAGPSREITVRRKAKRFGIWVNAESVHLSRVPSFYAVASTKPLSDVLSATGPDAIVDWVVVELRDKNDNTSILHSRAALLQADGDVVDVDGFSPVSISAPSDSYHIAVLHRNHLGVMSAAPIALTSTATSEPASTAT